MESLLVNLKKQLTCSICLDTYTEPKTISCLHTFCCECLEKHAKVSQKKGKFRCPECQAAIDLLEGNRFDRLPNSFFHKSLLSLLAVRQSGEASSITCYQCSATNSQMYYCFDCGRFMCPDCFNAHEVLKKSFQGHKVTPVQDFKAEDYEALLRRQPFCSQEFHEREITRLFCLQCKVCICPICIVTDHQNHKVVLLDKAAHEEKNNIMSGAKLIKNMESELQEVIRQFEETISKLESNMATAKRSVKQAAEQMIANIREREREALESLEATRVSRLHIINSAKREVESLVKQMNQAAQFAENLVQRTSSSDIMQNKETLKTKFEELLRVEVPKHQQTSFVKFTAASEKDLKLGFIEVTEDAAKAAKSTIEGLDKTLQAGVEAEFTLCPKTSGGEMSNEANLKGRVELLIKPVEDVRNVVVEEKEDGNLRLKFTPKAPGTCSIEVKIDGDKLPHCPTTVRVKERELVVSQLKLQLFKGDALERLYGIAVNTEGQIILTDNFGHCVYVFDKNGNCLRKSRGEGSNTGRFQYPYGISLLNDNEVLIANLGNSTIQRLNIHTGTVVKSFGKIGNEIGELENPVDVTVDDEGRVVVTEWGNNRIQVMSDEGQSIFTFGDKGPEKLCRPTCCIPYKNMFLVSDGENHCIKAFDQSGTFLYKFGKEGYQDGQFKTPYGLLVDSSNNLLVCDFDNNRVQQFSLDGRFIGKSITRLSNPTAITKASDGRILVASHGEKKVYILK